MAKAALKCAKCSRTFKMPAHLARHMNTIHSSGKAKAKAKAKARLKAKRKVKASARRKVARPKRASKKTVRRVRAARPAKRASTGGVGRLITEMRAYLGELSTRREVLDAEMTAITEAMQTIGVAVPAKKTARKPGRRPGPRPGRRPRPGLRSGSLKEYMVRVLRQRSPMGPSDIARAVRKAGYKSTAKDLTKAVSNSLPELKIVKKAGFGLYRV